MREIKYEYCGVSDWDDKLTKELIEMVEKKFQKRVTDFIITHAHADRIGGIKR